MGIRKQDEAFFSSECRPGFSVGSEASENPEEVGFQLDLSASLFSFPEAQSLCESLGDSQVASILNAQEQALLRQVIADAPDTVPADASPDVWIGLIDPVAEVIDPPDDTSRFQWLDGSDFDFGTTAGVEPWGPQEPNNFQNLTEACVE